MKSITDNLNLSLLEIFAVLLPGGAAIILGLQIEVVNTAVEAVIPKKDSEWKSALLFLGVSYFVGYVLFYLGSLLDDRIYEQVRFLLFKPKEEDALTLNLIEFLNKSKLTGEISDTYKLELYNALLPLIQKMDKLSLANKIKFMDNLSLVDNKMSNCPGVDNIQKEQPLQCTAIEKSLIDKWINYNQTNSFGLLNRIKLLVNNLSLVFIKTNQEQTGLASIIKKYFEGKNQLFRTALDIKKRETSYEGLAVINLYKWAVAKLLIVRPAMYAEVERFQTASKFFRSMVIVSLVAIFLYTNNRNVPMIWMSYSMLLLSMLIYLQQRYKAVRTAYEYVVVLESNK